MSDTCEELLLERRMCRLQAGKQWRKPSDCLVTLAETKAFEMWCLLEKENISRGCRIITSNVNAPLSSIIKYE